MQKTDLSNANERKKLVVAAVLGFTAIVVLWWAFIGFGGNSPTKPTQRPAAVLPPSPGSRTTASAPKPATATEVSADLLAQLEPISYQQPTINVPEPKRNIFAFYVAPAAAPAQTPVPTPTPTPPLMLATVSPSNVYARTGDFTLDVTGDKFSPEVRIVIDNREMPTRYHSPQQVSAIVPAALISTPGQRQVVVRTPDGRLYSNPSGFSVTPPPTPNYSYIGIIGTKHYVDVALLQDRSNKELLNVHRGDVLSGRFRVTSISDKEVVLTDTTLKIKHSLAMSADGDKGTGPFARPTPKVVDAEDDEPDE
jgi:hypothetical protein